MEEQADSSEETRNRVTQIISENRPSSRGIDRALENQIIGSILNQIDTGIERPIDFVPTNYFDRCANLIFGINSQNFFATRVTQQSVLNVADNSVSFSRRVDQIGIMSQDGSLGQQNGTGSGEPLQNGLAGDLGAVGGVDEPLSQLMAMFTQQNQMMSNCIDEMKHLREEMNSLSRRVTDAEGSIHHGTLAPPSSTSTPEAIGNAGIGSQGQRGNNESIEGRGTREQPPREHSQYNQSIVPRRKNVDLDKWHIKFDGTGKGMTVESFVFRIERLKEQYEITYAQLFTDFHALVSGGAAKWYWQLLEDHEEDPEFGYFELKREMLDHYRSLDSDYEIIREIMERKQQPSESFEDFYGEIHNLTFRLRKKMPEKELVGIIKGNLKSSLACLIFSAKIEKLSDLKSECKRAEKLVRENRSRYRQVSEIDDLSEVDRFHDEKIPNVEAITQGVGKFGFGNSFARDNQQKNVGKQNVQTRSGTVENKTGSSAVTGNRAFCPSPFHLTLCFTCGMPGDYFVKNPAEAVKETRCKCTFHEMVCFACGKNESYYCPKNVVLNSSLAELTGSSVQDRDNPESEN